MLLLNEPKISEESDCPYIKGEKWRFSYFFAKELSGEDLEYLLARGWRKFGFYFFRPQCRSCSKCIPLRLRTDKISLTKSQRRVVRKGENIRVEFNPLQCRDEIFDLYRIHSMERFSRDADYEDFLNSFYVQSCPTLQSEYYLDNKLFGVGYLDISSASLSSVYFIYDTEYMKYSPGTLSIIKEAEYAESIGLSYYYLGYYIEENRSMSYKNNFNLNEKLNWETGIWEIPEELIGQLKQ